ncbi:hypothetical protein [Candidatus Phytoplasma fraxini]|uniref:Sequence-variable mosaic (SVM) signal sequence domain-containing protein n=1 Tax=Ash yellows phytoplasma TaxID=35780 RepID=A0ABZ2U8I8_ASHYP
MIFQFVLIICVVLFIIFIMNKCYDSREKNKIKIYLLNCSKLERQVLKSIFTDNKDKEFFLTKNNSITNNIINFNIAFEIKENSNNMQLSCVLNLEILNLIQKDLNLKKMYLEEKNY